MKVKATSLPDIKLLEPEVHEDQRGFFFESYRASHFAELGIQANFVQDNHSGSRRAVLRGLHYQIRQPQGKLVRAIAGRLFDVAVDLRRSSPTFGQWVGTELDAGDRRMVWIPPGFAHGFYAISEWCEVLYKVTAYHAPDWERTLLWNDPALGIQWPLIEGQPPLLSEKDATGAPLAEAETYP